MPALISVEDVSKTFPGVRALSGVRFELMPGEVHAVMGENGAGKSTLMKILAGVYTKDSGAILYNGAPVDFASPREAQAAATSADKMAEAIGGSGEVAVIVHDQTGRTGIDRRDGFVNPELEGHLRRQRRLGRRRGDRRQGIGQEARADRLRLGQGAEGGYQLGPHVGRDHAEPGRHRQVHRRLGGQGAEGREAAKGHRHRLLLVRQEQHDRPEDRCGALRLRQARARKDFGPS
ncbi:MAG: ATP-binding cassette domain-containing protein, partial [Hyphomicrobiales bacterium]|nr:ATP-binding cassette domain-containing protein [Hyphomicrobiales bacterium]